MQHKPQILALLAGLSQKNKGFKMTKLSRLLFAASFVLAAGAAQAMPVYDATVQFDKVNNPSATGGWSYGYSTTLGGAFSLFAVSQTTTMTTNTTYTFFDWIEKQNDFYPDIEKNTSGVDINTSVGSGITLVWPKDAITLGGDVQNNYVPVLRWTAPTAGEYLVDVTYTGVWDTTGSSSYSSNSNVYVLVDGVTFFSGYLEDLSSATYSKNITLDQGDHVDFTLQHIYGALNTFDRSMVKATITETTAVPEPASLALLGLGLAGLGLVRRRNSQKNKV